MYKNWKYVKLFYKLYDSITNIIDIRIYCKILISAESFQRHVIVIVKINYGIVIEKYILEILLNFLWYIFGTRNIDNLLYC